MCSASVTGIGSRCSTGTGTGFCLWYKRLEKANFHWPRKHSDGVIRWGQREFNWLLEGFDVMRMQGRQHLRSSAANSGIGGASCY